VAGEVTLVSTVPSAVPELLRSDSLPESVKTIQLAGEALPRSTVQLIQKRSSVLRILNLYGPTEDSVYSTGAEVDPNSDREPSIGRPLAGKTFRILDRNLQPVPAGVPGELYIGGWGLASGYLN